MPYRDEEYPGQTLWQSVLLFGCKGMIEVIMVILFFWLLVQVLFTKHLEVHLQVLLLVGLAMFCLSLVLGCVLCWWKSRIGPFGHKHPEAPAPAPEDPVAVAQGPLPGAVVRQRYEELDGDVLELPSAFSSPALSEDAFGSLAASPGACASEHRERPMTYFSLRRLSTPPMAPTLYKPVDHNRVSLPSLPKLGLLAKTRRALERRCSATGGGLSCSESSRLTSPCAPEEPIPLDPLCYGSGCSRASSSYPRLRFTAAFSPEQRAVTVTVVGLTGTPHRLEEVSVLGSLHPLHACPMLASVRCSVNSEPQSLVLVFNVASAEELQRCVLRMSLHTRHPAKSEGSPLGELEVLCGGRDWKSDQPIHFTKELHLKKWMFKKNLNSQDASLSAGLSCSPQLFILLQYQTLAHHIKVMVLRADKLDGLTPFPAAPDYRVVINLRHRGVVMGTRETRAGSNSVLNTPFLFDLPPGDISQLHVMLEFIVMQNRSVVLGRVLIGPEAPEAGRAHWRDMCSQGQVERARWHTVQPEAL